MAIGIKRCSLCLELQSKQGLHKSGNHTLLRRDQMCLYNDLHKVGIAYAYETTYKGYRFWIAT